MVANRETKFRLHRGQNLGWFLLNTESSKVAWFPSKGHLRKILMNI